MIDRLQDRRTTTDERVRVLSIDDDATDDVFDALASDTGRAAFRAVFDEPGTPSEIADRIDTSVQNVHYHVSNLEEAGLIESIDTVYSAKGNEMAVYGPTSDPIVFVADEEQRPTVERSLTGVVGGIALLGLASLFVQWGAGRLVGVGRRGSSAVGPASWEPGAARPVETAGWLLFDVLEPGLVFFVLGLVLATLVVALAERR